jgi:prepilin peptidase CpaA
METVTLLLLSLLPALVIAAGLHDLTTMKIPNWISGLLILGFFPTALMVGLSPMAVAFHVGVAVLALFCGMAMFALRMIGGGDAKLMAAAMLWIGASGAPYFVLYTAVVGGLFCLVLMIGRKQMVPFVAHAPGWFANLMQPKGDVPYGVAIAAGVLLAFPASALVTTFSGGA